MTKVLKTFSYIVIILFSLSIFGWMVQHIEKGDKKFGFITGYVKFIYTFPDMFKRSVNEVKTLPKTFVKTPDGFEPINKLDFNLTVLTTFSDTSDARTIALVNLKNDSLLYKWTFENPHREHERILNPLLFPEKNLVFSWDGKALMRVDSLGNLKWKQDSIWSHHAMNLDSNGDIWVCTFPTVFFATGLYKLDGRSVFYKDNYIAKIDAETGKILYYKSITEIFKENNLTSYLLKSGQVWDPIHHNDVEPALKATPYYNEGDVFLSFRQPSLILQYRPSTGEVIRVIEGLFVSQHDVDFYGNNSIVCFNNNYYTFEKPKDRKPAPKDSVRLVFANDIYSNIVKYNFENDNFTLIGDSIFRANEIFSRTESLVDFLDTSTYFVEEQNSGLLWIIKDDEVIYKNVFKSQHKGYHHLPNWTRIIYDYE